MEGNYHQHIFVRIIVHVIIQSLQLYSWAIFTAINIVIQML